MIITKTQLKRTEKDMAGNIRVWVEIKPSECRIFKFRELPTLTQIQAEVDKIKEPTKEEQVVEIDKQIFELTERKKQLLEIKAI